MDHESLLALYDRRRGHARAFNDELSRSAGKEALATAGRRLGILRKGVFVFDNEQEMAVLSDACLYAVRDAAGENSVQRTARSGRYAAGSPEQEVLDAMSRARFSLFTLGDSAPGVWIEATDVFTGASCRIVDRGLSITPCPMFATRLVDYPEFSMTTGAGMPVATERTFWNLTKALDAKGISPAVLRSPDLPVKVRDDFYYAATAHLLRAGVLRTTRYIDPTNPTEVAELAAETGEGLFLDEDDDAHGPWEIEAPQTPVRRESPKVGRNDPCPCGSGKKYKKCHGA